MVQSWKQGDRLLLNGKMLTGRDAAHKRIKDMLDAGEALPVEFTGRVIYYVGPVDPVGEEVVGPAGPTTATRMDKFTRHDARSGPARDGRQGRARARRDRGDRASTRVAYLMAVGGAAYLVARAIKGSKVVGFEDLGMEAIYEFEVEDLPVTVAVDAEGKNVHQLAPLVWREKIAREGCSTVKSRAPTADTALDRPSARPRPTSGAGADAALRAMMRRDECRRDQADYAARARPVPAGARCRSSGCGCAISC